VKTIDENPTRNIPIHIPISGLFISGEARMTIMPR